MEPHAHGAMKHFAEQPGCGAGENARVANNACQSVSGKDKSYYFWHFLALAKIARAINVSDRAFPSGMPARFIITRHRSLKSR
jgi:hypothetical protein